MINFFFRPKRIGLLLNITLLIWWIIGIFNKNNLSMNGRMSIYFKRWWKDKVKIVWDSLPVQFHCCDWHSMSRNWFYHSDHNLRLYQPASSGKGTVFVYADPESRSKSAAACVPSIISSHPLKKQFVVKSRKNSSIRVDAILARLENLRNHKSWGAWFLK